MKYTLSSAMDLALTVSLQFNILFRRVFGNLTVDTQIFLSPCNDSSNCEITSWLQNTTDALIFVYQNLHFRIL